jgi:hypothetical protein
LTETGGHHPCKCLLLVASRSGFVVVVIIELASSLLGPAAIAVVDNLEIRPLGNLRGKVCHDQGDHGANHDAGRTHFGSFFNKTDFIDLVCDGGITPEPYGLEGYRYWNFGLPHQEVRRRRVRS